MSEYVLKSTGRVFRRQADIVIPGETEIEVNPSMINAMVPKSRVKLSNFMPSPYGLVGASITEQETIFSVRLFNLILNCTIAIGDDGSASPTWQHSGTFVELIWPVPDTMKLFYCARVTPFGTTYKIHSAGTYLFALGVKNRSYRLPLPNIYDDGHICTGVGDVVMHSPVEAFLDCLTRFMKSQWNADLANEPMRTRAAQLFQFKVVPDGFKALAAPKEWASLCWEASNSVLEGIPAL